MTEESTMPTYPATYDARIHESRERLLKLRRFL